MAGEEHDSTVADETSAEGIEAQYAYDEDEDDTGSGEEPIPSESEPAGDDAGKGDADGESSRDRSDDDDPLAGFHPDSVATARGLGFTDQEIAEFGDPALLDRNIAMLTRKGLIVDGQRTSRPTRDQQTDTDAGENRNQAKTGDGKPSGRFELPKEIDDYDEPIASTIKAMNDHYAEQVEALQKTIGDLTDRQRVDSVMQDVGWLDSQIAELGEAGKELFGEGPSLEMDDTSQQFKNRDKLFDMVLTLARAQSSSGRRVGRDPALFKRAFHAQFHDKAIQRAHSEARANINTALKKQSGSVMGRPKSRSNRPATGHAAAVAFLKEFEQQRGVPDIPAEDDEF